MAERRPTARSRLGFIRLLLVLDIIALGLVLYDAPVFKVAGVRVSGTRELAPAEVVEAAALDGANLLGLDPAKKEAAIRRLHWIKSATVERRFPNEVVIRVTERRPVAIWLTKDGRFLVDDEGVVLGSNARYGIGGASLVTVYDTSSEGLAPGSRLAAGIVAGTRQLMQLLPEAGVVPREFMYDTAGGLTVVAEQGWKVRFGGPESVAFKVAVLKELIPVASRQRFELIDLRSPDRPYFR